MNYPERGAALLQQAKEASVNTVVCDFNGANPAYLKNFNRAKELGLYRIARIVVFEEGLGATYQTAEDPKNWQHKLALSKQAEDLGFDEIQYDYIRFSDRGTADPRKKDIIGKFLQDARATVKIPIGADVFGSVAYQPHHIIGQDLTRMSPHLDAVSPMLYPSHFYGDRLRLSNPYRTVLEGSTLGMNKIHGYQVRMIPYIQGFAMNMGYANISLYQYIKEQIRACEDAGTDGFFVWHAGNEYATTFAVLKDYGALYQKPPLPKTEIYQYLGVTANVLLY
ncbi:hypothetical protein NO2_0732 [Candidatus Termititenax persephonae]|uniref:DUF4015 domain-containing protein n=1 Tax=Candidatus Termititenax persephonae TaxID=2218525 RepID=A0A388THF1_9BACT|nr:hypothetical protein NO2_0732 [Candidatus Termititenax persephonae]